MSSKQAEIEATLEEVRRRKAQSEQLLEQFGNERRSLIVPARAGGNESAKVKLAEVEAQIAMQTRERDHDVIAIAELERQLEQEKISLASSQNKERREQLAATIDSAAQKVARIASRVSELSAALNEAAELCASAISLAGYLDEADAHGSDSIRRFAIATRGAVISSLDELSKSAPHHGVMSAIDRLKHFGSVLASTAEGIRVKHA